MGGREGGRRSAIGRNMELTIIIFLSGFPGRNVPLMFPDDLSVSPVCFFFLFFLLFPPLCRGDDRSGFLGGEEGVGE